MVLRIFKIIATSGLLAALECTKFVLGRDSAPDPAGGAYRPSSWFKGPTSKGKGARRKRGKGEKKGREKEREGPPLCKFLDPPLLFIHTCLTFAHQTSYTSSS